jgi:hypothetical protein
LRFKDLQEFGNIVDDTKCSFLPNLIESNFWSLKNDGCFSYF